MRLLSPWCCWVCFLILASNHVREPIYEFTHLISGLKPRLGQYLIQSLMSKYSFSYLDHLKRSKKRFDERAEFAAARVVAVAA